MKQRKHKKLALLLILAMVFQGFPNLVPGEFSVEMGEFVENVTTAYAADPGPMYMIYDSQDLLQGDEVIEMRGATATIGIGISGGGGLPSGTKVEWTSYNENLLRVVRDSNNDYAVNITAIAPGYTLLTANIKVGEDTYTVQHQIYIPIRLAERSEEDKVNIAYDSNYGMINPLATDETAETKTIQLSTEAGSDLLTHYLPIFQYANYARGVNSVSDDIDGSSASVFSGNVKWNEVWTWTSSDENVVKVNPETGFITAVGAGYATVKVQGNTTSQKDEKVGEEFEILVTPSITGVTGAKWEKDKGYYLANTNNITFQTNAIKAASLTWEIYRNSMTEENKVDISMDDDIVVNISESGSTVALSNVPAGVYYLEATITDKYSESNTKVKNLSVCLVVAPSVIETSGVDWKNEEKYYLANSENVTFTTNADGLTWQFYRYSGDQLKDEDKISNDEFMHWDLNKTITLTNMTAGVYALEATPSQELIDAGAEKLFIKLVVPLRISEKGITMNPNEEIDLLVGTNVRNGSLFKGEVTGLNGEPTNIAEIIGTTLYARSGGKGYVRLHYNGAGQDFPGIKQSNDIYKDDYEIPLTVMGETENRPWPENSNISFYMTYNSKVVEDGEVIEMTSNTATIGVGNSTGVWPSDAWIEWKVGNTNVVRITESPDSKYMGIATAMGPGYTDVQPIVHYDNIEYPLPSRQIHVPLTLATTSKENRVNFAYDNWYGMIDQLAAGETVDTKTIQLSTKESAEHPTHYLPIFRYVNYAQGNNSISNLSGTPASVFANGVRMNEVWEWFSSDETVVKVDAETGYITAVGAGYATVTVQTKTTDAKGGRDAKTFGILVTPGIDSVSGAAWKEEGEYYLADSLNITFLTNAEIASNLEWSLYRNKRTEDNRLDIAKNDYLNVDISNIGNGVTFSNVDAGVYYLVARPTDKYSITNTKVNNMIIKVIVPLMISEDEIFMNVGDQYDLFSNTNIPEKGMFSYEITDRNGNPVTALNPLAEISGGVLTALQIGEGYLVIHYRGGDKDIFADAGVDAALLYKEEYKIPLTVIDRLVITAETNTMYVGSTLPLVLSAGYNKNASITWSSSDESILTVKADEDNASKAVVTAKAPGIAVVTATQTVNGVTKSATYTITVLPAITGITLEPKSMTIEIGDQKTITATVSPKVDTTNVSLYWVTSDASIVSIEQSNGLSAVVKGVRGGTAVITAINQQNIVVGSCVVTVRQPITSIRLSQTRVTIPLSSKSFQLQATILPEAARNEEIIWTSTDTSIITVDQYGLVTLRKAGSAAIICSSAANGKISAICNVTVTKSVTGIKLDQTALNLAVGESYRLTYTINPADAANVAVTWASTNNSIVTVDAKGLVRARSVGQAVIILRTVDGGYMATCVVTVSQAATGVKLDVNALTLNVGDYYNLEAAITPANSTDVSLSWESSDKKVAIVSNKGKVTAKAPGVAIILVRTKNGASAYCTVTVQQGVTSVKLDSREETIYVGDEIFLDATISPKSATLTDVKWSSSKTSVARVNADGEVTGISPGVAIITCTTVDGGYTDYCVIIVERPEVEVSEITVDPEEYMLGVGKTYRLTATVTPDNATNKEVIWSSSDTSIVTVDSKGRLRGIAPGTAIITCEADDGSGAEAYCEVEVYTQMTDISLNYNYLDMVVGDSETLTAEITPANATYGIYWESADPSIAIVNKTTGRVTALKAGDTTITAKADDNSGMNTVCFVHVKNPVATTNIQVSESELVMIPGETKSVSFTILPAGHTDGYVWSSDNPVVASVDARTGLITAQSMGTANITIFADSGRSASVKVYVVGLSKTTLTLQQYTSTIISLEVFGASKSDLDVRWYSENERIAEVANGKITGRAIGTTYVYAVVNGRTLACRVTVEKIRSN